MLGECCYRKTINNGALMKQIYCHYPAVVYFPKTAHPEVLSSSYSQDKVMFCTFFFFIHLELHFMSWDICDVIELVLLLLTL